MLDKSPREGPYPDSLAGASTSSPGPGRRRAPHPPDPPLLMPIQDAGPDRSTARVRGGFHELLAGYRRTLQTDRQLPAGRFEFVDMARKVVGVGSVGTRCWIILMRGRDDTTRCSCRSRKPRTRCRAGSAAAQRATSARAAGRRGPAAHAGRQRHLPGLAASSGRRAAARTTTSASSRDWKDSAVSRPVRPSGLQMYGEAVWLDVGQRACPDRRPDRHRGLPRRGRCLPQRRRRFAALYADQNERDYRSLTDAIASGRVIAVSDV